MGSNRKVYARQVPWEWQESPWDIWREERLAIDKAAVYGNKQFKGSVFDEFEQVIKALDEMDFDDVGADRWYENEQEMLLDWVPPVGRNAYTEEEIEQWREACNLYAANYGRDERKAICMGLTLMMGKEYDYCQLSGCCQSDWNYFFYPVELYDDKAIRCVEVDYFNLGEEWMVHDESTVPECAADVTGYIMYVYNDARREIAEEAGVAPENVVLWEYDGMRQVPKYKEA